MVIASKLCTNYTEFLTFKTKPFKVVVKNPMYLKLRGRKKNCTSLPKAST